MRSSRVWVRSGLVVDEIYSRVWMWSSRVVRASDNQCRSHTCPGSIPASSDTVESEGRQMKQCWIQYWDNSWTLRSLVKQWLCVTFEHVLKSDGRNPFLDFFTLSLSVLIKFLRPLQARHAIKNFLLMVFPTEQQPESQCAEKNENENCKLQLTGSVQACGAIASNRTNRAR